MRRLFHKIIPEKDSLVQWQTKTGNITTNFKINVDFTFPALSVANFVTCKCHVDESAKGCYEMILDRDILTELVSNLKNYDNIIKSYDGPFI